jgi:hypothetical protein
MGRPLFASPIFLFFVATAFLFVGAAFVYMSNKSPYFWGGLFFPGLALLVVFVLTAVVSVVGLLRPAR